MFWILLLRPQAGFNITSTDIFRILLTLSWIKMAKYTFKILRCSHRKIFKVCLAILQHYAWKGYASMMEFFLLTIFFKKTLSYHRCFSRRHASDLCSIFALTFEQISNLAEFFLGPDFGLDYIVFTIKWLAKYSFIKTLIFMIYIEMLN